MRSRVCLQLSTSAEMYIEGWSCLGQVCSQLFMSAEMDTEGQSCLGRVSRDVLHILQDGQGALDPALLNGAGLQK